MSSSTITFPSHCELYFHLIFSYLYICAMRIQLLLGWACAQTIPATHFLFLSVPSNCALSVLFSFFVSWFILSFRFLFLCGRCMLFNFGHIPHIFHVCCASICHPSSRYFCLQPFLQNHSCYLRMSLCRGLHLILRKLFDAHLYSFRRMNFICRYFYLVYGKCLVFLQINIRSSVQ